MGVEGSAVRPRHTARLATASFVRCGQRLLLLRHGPGSDRFAGRGNGVGGHVEAGEGLRAAARRELLEEAGLTVEALRPAPGVELAWHDLSRLPELPLVDDLHELLPRLLANQEPVLAVERYDGRDCPLAFAFDGEGPAPRGGTA